MGKDYIDIIAKVPELGAVLNNLGWLQPKSKEIKTLRRENKKRRKQNGKM